MKEGCTFSHWGIPTTEEKPGMTYIEGIKTAITDFAASPFAVEWLKFDADCTMPKLIQQMPHVAFIVKDMTAALAGEKVIVDPFPVGDNLVCAFIEGDGFAVELMQFK